MRIRTIGLAALMAGSLMGDGLAQSVQEEIQEDEVPGSEIEMDVEPGRVVIGRQKYLNPSPSRFRAAPSTLPTIRIRPLGKTQSMPSWPARDLRICPVPTTTIRSPTDELTRLPDWPRRHRPPALRHRLFRGVSSRAA